MQVSELDALSVESEQFLWGSTQTDTVQALAERLAGAKAFSRLPAATVINHVLVVQVSELDALLLESEQFLWGSTQTDQVQALAEQLAGAKAWVSRVYAFSKSKPTLQALQPIVQREPAPCSMPAFTKLREAYQHGQAWLLRAAEPLAGNLTELKATLQTAHTHSRDCMNV